MLEQVTDAIVLDKEWHGEANARVHLFTKEWGRITVKATSARKITSKLGAHLEPLTIATVRLVQKNHLPRVIDAVRRDKLSFNEFAGVWLIKELAAEYEPDPALWAVARNPARFTHYARAIMGVLGYDPQCAACVRCGGAPAHFSTRMLSFVCNKCVLFIHSPSRFYDHIVSL